MPTTNGTAESAIAFLKSLYQRCEQSDGFINLRFISPKGGVRNNWIPIDKVEKNLPSILASHRGYNCFFGVALREKGKGKKKSLTRIPSLWIDIDKKHFDEEKKKEFSARFEKFPLKPSFVVTSGGGLHLYWKLRVPASPENVTKIEDLNKRLASYFFADPASCEAARVMRLPGSRNLKYESKPEVEISQKFSNNNRSYTLENLDLKIPPLEIPPSKERTERLEPGWEKALLGGVEEGERNSALTRVAGHWISHGLSKEEVILFARAWNEKNNPPLPNRELLTTIGSIWKKHYDRNPERDQEGTANKPDLKLTTMRDIFDYPKPSYLIDQVLPEGIVTALGAYTGTGKSLVTLSMIKALLTKEPLWGKFKVKKKGPVLLIDEETPESFLRDRLEKMNFMEDFPLYFLHFQDVRLDSPGCLDTLKNKVREIKPLLIVIDSLIRVHRKKEDDATEMSIVMHALRGLANLGTTVLIIHHHKKGDGVINQRLRGSSDIPGGIDIEYALVPKDGCLLFSSVKTRTKPLPPMRLKLIANEKQIEVVYQGAQLEKTDQVLMQLFPCSPNVGR